MSDAPKGTQVVFIPTLDDEGYPVPSIVKEYKLYFNPCLISLTITWSVF